MKSRMTIPVILLAAVSLAACGADSDGASTSTSQVDAATTTTVAATVTISVTVGTDSGEDRTEQVPLGSAVKVTLVNPGAVDNFHLHGYDIETGDIEAGQSAVIAFTADQAGTFEIESHKTEDVLVVLEVG